MSQDPFTSPGSAGAGIAWADYNGALLLIEVHALETGIKTTFGDTDAIRADVVVIDGEDKGERYDDTLVFPKILQSQLRSKVGQKVLGRLGQGTAKPGQSAPWILAEATEEDKKDGVAYLTGQMSTAQAPF